MMKITVINNRFLVETPDSRIHMLSVDALKWNLKKVFGFTGEEVLSIIVALELEPMIEISLKEVA